MYAPEPIGEKESGLQMELYKFYSPLYSIPNLSARPPTSSRTLARSTSLAPSAPGLRCTPSAPAPRRVSASTTAGPTPRDGPRVSPVNSSSSAPTPSRSSWTTARAPSCTSRSAVHRQRLGVRDTGETAAVVKQNKVHLAAGYHNIRVEFFVDSTWTQLRLWYSGPGFPRQVVPANKFFADASCCLSRAREGSVASRITARARWTVCGRATRL